jgi:ABC-type molybdate transport system substrate-binding protein
MKPAIVALIGLVAAGAAPRGELRVKASPAVRPCVAAAAALFQKTSGIPTAVRTADVFSVTSAEGADVVVAVEEELTRVIEGGASRPDQDVEVARIPWVLVTSARQPAADVEALERSADRVLVLGGTVGREARRSLQSLAPSRVRTLRDPEAPVSLEPGEAAVVPLSLAPPGEVRSLALPPLLVRAVGVRASPRPEAARAFLDFLTSGPGSSVFSACGREDTP